MSDVNFTPNRGAYKELTPFRYWCQKVLPLVYDDSISYYELLCKVVNYLNITMEDVSTLNDDVTAMYTAYDELQDFVNQYFTDLNVQTQIDNKLDRMAADGSLNALIDPLVRETTIYSVAGALPDVVEDQLPDVVDSQIDDVVDNWLDRHPEATTTVQDGSITTEKFTPILKSAIEASPVNVLLFGVKNDGTTDCSDLINELTQTYELYFPAGVYRVDNPIYLYHSISGAGASRQFSYTPTQGTIFKSYISGDNNNGVLNVNETACDIKNVCIVINDTENGINVSPHASTPQNTIIDGCTVTNVYNYGILCDSVNRSSRLAYIRNCAVFGRANAPSRGMYIGNRMPGPPNEPDCYVLNCEIMACQQGIYNNAGILRVINTHIWCGQLNQNYDGTWWKNTVGIYASSSIYLDSCYIDTVSVAVLALTSNPVKINNIIVWDDNSGVIESADRNYLFSIQNDANANYRNIFINGATIRINEEKHLGLFSTNLFHGYNAFYNAKNINVISDAEMTPFSLYYPRLGVTEKSDHIAITVANNKAVCISDIAFQYGGSAILTIFHDNNESLLTLRKNYGWKLTNTYGNNMPLYAREVTTESSEKHRQVFYYNTSGSTVLVEVDRVSHGNAFMDTYGHFNANPRTHKIPITLDDTTGLTELTYS